MPANKFASIRYHVIDKLLRNKYKPYPSVEDIMEKCSETLLKPISKSSIEKDIRAMKFDEGLGYFAPIEFSRTHRGYYYSNSEFSIDTIPLNDEEIEAVKFATNILTQFKNVAIFKEYENAIDKVLDKVNLSTQKGSKHQNYIQFEQQPTVHGSEYLSPIVEAIKQHLQVRFIYKSFKSDQEKERLVSPYLLKEYKNRWYLLAQDSTKTYKVFGLERMHQLEVTKDTFEWDNSIHHPAYFDDSLGVTTQENGTPQKIKFECNHILKQYLESQPIHHSQVIVPNKNGAVVHLTVYMTYELIQLLLGFGNEVKVLEPKELVDQLIRAHQSALNVYKQ